MDEYYIWIGFPRSSPEYIRGIKAFLKNAFPIYKNGDQMKCPCKKCTERNWYCQDVIYDHLVCNGPSPLHADWICEVSQTKLGGTDDFEDCEMGIEFEDNLDVMFNYTRKNFENQGGCEDEPNANAKKFFRESAFGELLKLIKEAFPDANLPLSFKAAKSVIRDLGLDYEKIHACPNSCMLYWGKNKEKNKCETCGVSRWVVHEKDGIVENNDPPKLIHKVAANVMRLGVAADGFNPYHSMNLSHSTWPIMLPLISELKALWKDGVETFDSLTSENFNLRASALWTISDFPGYAMLSSWSTKGKLACPECHYETSSVNLKHSKKTVNMNHRMFLDPTHEWRLDKKRFNGEMEMGNSPVPLTGTEIEELLWGYENQFGEKTRRKQPFFDIMVHLPVHLCREVEYGGPEHQRCMFAIERYLGKLKGYVRNRSRPEGSIAEGEHRAFMDGLASQQKYKRERAHMEDFWKWLKDEVLKKENISRDLEVFALGPNRLARKFTGYVINGYKFHTKFGDSRCTTQNSGVFLTTETTTFASSKDQNPVVGGVNYYGSIEEIFELDYWGAFTVVMFKCCWYQEEKDSFGLTRVNFNKLRQKSDPFVLSSQVQQVFYVDDPVEKNCQYVIRKLSRDWCDTENQNAMEEDLSSYHSYNIGINCKTEGVWTRDDVPLTQIRVPSP
ncbi:uncharacterized protein LOC141714968 [Apium graveolens]|uniref:uncharacterized protein LOC141714968 n=1 Tax=Apium graveolens TaxID=4045 RepID=UPI003D79273E